MLITICIPCYHSAKTLPSVVAEIQEEFAKRQGYDYRLVLVNDCSPDNTFEVIKELCAGDDKITGIDLSRNFGQSCAKLAGLQYFRGDALVYMDDDGQHPAEGIFPLADKIAEGFDVVYTKFAHKQHSAFKRATSAFQNWLKEIMGQKPKGITVSAFMAWSPFVVGEALKYHSPFPSAGGYLMHITNRYANVDGEHRKRIAGKSGYTLKKLFKLWFTVFTNFSLVPLRLSAFIGAFCAFAGFFGGVVIVIRKIINHPAILAGYTSTIALLLFIGGIIMMILGLMGEYIGRIYMLLNDMPQYAVRETVGTEKEEVNANADR